MREKLIELLKCVPDVWMAFKTSEKIADYLIANGVRLEEKQATSDESKRWIPVTERLPEVFAPVLVKYLGYNDGSASPTNVDTAVLLEGNVWYWWEGDLADCDDEVKCTITHWMPLPEPPKGC